MTKPFKDLPAILLAAILVLGAGVRFYFADANSYWLDELYSVATYGIDNGSTLEALERLADKSIHPPLYQALLYNWMAVFGDGEIATRSLSNLFIVGATLCLFLAVRKVYGAWTGVLVALVFTVMFTPTFYGLETRSYAQTIFLSSLSTLLLIHALPRLAQSPARSLIKDGWVLGLLAVNTALMLTHYYNVLFLGAQGLFLVIYLLWATKRPVIALARSLAVGLVPIVTLVVTWGLVMVDNYERFGGREKFMVQGLPWAPWEMLRRFTIWWNFPNDNLVVLIWGLIAFLTVITIMRLVRQPADKSFFTLWFLMAATVPVLLAFVLFLVSGHARYSSRYFVFSVGPLAVVFVLSLCQAMDLLRRIVKLPNWVALGTVTILAVALAVPGGLFALQKTKTDWRGIAETVVERVGREPEKEFFVFSTSSGTQTDYYLSRFSSEIRVDDRLSRTRAPGFVRERAKRADADYILVVFTKHTAPEFRKPLKELEEVLTLSESRLDKTGRGYLVFSVPEHNE